jgi:hypothetical protein
VSEYSEKLPDPLDLAIEHAVERIERDLGKLDLVHRLEVEFALRQMVDELPHRMRDPWG